MISLLLAKNAWIAPPDDWRIADGAGIDPDGPPAVSLVGCDMSLVD